MLCRQNRQSYPASATWCGLRNAALVLKAIAYFWMMKTLSDVVSTESVHYSPVSATCRGLGNAVLVSMLLLVLQRWRAYYTRGSWRTAGLGMSREGSHTFDTGILSGGNIVSSM